MSDFRVLWINEHGNSRGGCEQYVHATARLLAAHGVTSWLIYDPARDAVDPAYLEAFAGASPIDDLASQVRELAPDLVYVHRLTGMAPIRALSGCGVPVLRFFHDHKLFCLREHKYTTIRHETCTRPVGACCYPCLGFIRRGGPFGVSFASVGALRREQAVNQSLTAFAVGSQYMAEHLALHGFDRERTHVLPLYAVPPIETPPVPREPDLLLFAGQLVRGKGLDTLLRALSQMKARARLLIIGTGRQELAFRALTQRLGLGDRVEFAGAMPHDVLEVQYRRAQCLVFPSRSPETFGLVGPEAMRFATPAVASDIGGVGEWLKDGVTGLAVRPNDPTMLAEALDRMVTDRTLAARLGENAQASYEKRFRPEHHIDRLLDTFRKVVESRQ